MFSTQVAPHLELTPPYPADAPLVSGTSRVRGAPAILGLFPASCLAEEIDTPGEGKIRGLVTVAANPVLSAPGADRLERALPLLDRSAEHTSALPSLMRISYAVFCLKNKNYT